MTYVEKHSPTFHFLTFFVVCISVLQRPMHVRHLEPNRGAAGSCWNFQEFGPNGRMLDHSKCALEIDTRILTSLTLLPG